MAKVITALMINPGERPVATRLYLRPHFLEYAVSTGSRYLCQPAFFKLKPNVGILYNSEAAMLGLPGNRKLGGKVFAGIIYIIGIDEKGEPASLSYSEMDRLWIELFDTQFISEKEVSDSFANELLSAYEGM